VITLGINMNDYKDQNLKSAIMFGAFVVSIIVGIIFGLIIN
jgi:hypothetical protein